jgi:hypothetical protein
MILFSKLLRRFMCSKYFNFRCFICISSQLLEICNSCRMNSFLTPLYFKNSSVAFVFKGGNVLLSCFIKCPRLTCICCNGKDACFQIELTSLLQMKEMGIKIGTAQNEPFTGRKRGLVTQHRAETISYSTLMDMLRYMICCTGVSGVQ